MKYEEATKILNDYSWLVELGTKEDGELISYPIAFKIISPASKFKEVFGKMMKDKTGNQKVLTELGLIDQNLRVFAVAKNNSGRFFEKDMYNYLLDTAQLGKTGN
jgi:hypothetical protein